MYVEVMVYTQNFIHRATAVYIVMVYNISVVFLRHSVLYLNSRPLGYILAVQVISSKLKHMLSINNKQFILVYTNNRQGFMDVEVELVNKNITDC